VVGVMALPALISLVLVLVAAEVGLHYFCFG
jgi:hypothetical protein